MLWFPLTPIAHHARGRKAPARYMKRTNMHSSIDRQVAMQMPQATLYLQVPCMLVTLTGYLNHDLHTMHVDCRQSMVEPLTHTIQACHGAWKGKHMSTLATCGMHCLDPHTIQCTANCTCDKRHHGLSQDSQRWLRHAGGSVIR